EVFGVRLQVPHIRLGVTAGAVQEDQHRLVGLTGVQVPGPHPTRVEIALGEGDPLQIAPHTLVVGTGPCQGLPCHPSRSPLCERPPAAEMMFSYSASDMC